MTIFDTFNIPTTFTAIPIGGEFIEALTTCNEVTIRTEPRMHQGKPVNVRRVGGKLIFMAEWEPVFADKRYIACIDCEHLAHRWHDTNKTHYCFHPHWATNRHGSIGTGSLWISSDTLASRFCPINRQEL